MTACSLVRRWKLPEKFLLPVSIATIAALLLSSAPVTRAQMLDLNTNSMSDVWEQLYAASGAVANVDSDGDGFSNLKEALAGTDPFDASSFPKISTATMASTFNVTIPDQLGKLYQLQSVATLGDTNWVVETNVVARSGSSMVLTAPANSAGKYFRTAVTDVDWDGDGLSDWEEYQLGLDPFDAMSNHQVDGNGQPMNDKAYVTGQFGLQNNVTIIATDASTMQPDVGTTPTDLGTIKVQRGGFPLRAVTVNLALGGPGAGFATENIDHAFLTRPVTLAAGVSSQNISVTPLADTNLTSPVIAMLKVLPGTGYTMGAASNASVVIYPSATPSGTGLSGSYYTNSSTTYASTNNFNALKFLFTRVDPLIDFNWTNGTSPSLSNGLYSVRWVGQVQPQYSETYYFDVRSDDGCKLWVNDQLILDNWKSQSVVDVIATPITLQGGTRHNIKLEYLQSGSKGEAHLFWYSASQAKQIIPTARLYPTNTPAAPASITSLLNAYGFVGQPFSFNVTGANTPLNFSATGLPPGLSFNNTNGSISGIPNLAGDYQVTLTASNSAGLGASLVNITIFDTGSSVVREVWQGVAGANISDIPLTTPATFTNTIGSLEGITNFGVNYGERIRGHLIAPATGFYYFWIAGSDAAELHVSNDNEPANKLKRASVSPAGGGTLFHSWNAQTNQQSKWLSLTAGKKYYVEILHKAGTTPNDHWSVGWLQDPLGTNTVPAAVVPGYVLSRYYPLPITLASGTLYSANMLAQSGVSSLGVGSATLRLSADGTQAILQRTFGNLSTNVTGEHIHNDTYLGKASQIMFDIDDVPEQPDGSFIWDIIDVGSLTAADVVEIIREGKAYINIHTKNYPAGEINGHFTLANGSQIFNPPPAPPVWADDHSNPNAAARFLIQSTFGASAAGITNVQSLGYDGWISNQFSLPPSHHLPYVLANKSLDPTASPYASPLTFNSWWQQSVTAPDQLRQRVAFALSEIMVISENGALQDNAHCLSSYYDMLVDRAFGNYRDLLKAVTLTPAMGLYLDMRGNDVGSIVTGLHPNENYAREILQLFSVGLNRMWPDGTLVLSSQNAIVPTYDQNTIMGFASTFTGWNYYQTNQANGRLPSNFNPPSNLTNPMVLVPTHHELGSKKLLDLVYSPGAVGVQTNSGNTNFDIYCSQNLEQSFDSIFNNPNVGPFICRQLIQRLVTSNPSRDYLYRVVQKFNDNGLGVRGDLAAVVRAILLDYEARSTNLLTAPTFGKQREPLLRVTAAARALPAPPNNGGTYLQGGAATITLTMTNAHRMNNGDVVQMNFADTSGNPVPPSQPYSVTSTGSNTLTVTAPNLVTGTYTQATNTIVVNIGSHGLAANNAIYLAFGTGGAVNGLYLVTSTPSSSVFTVSTPDAATRSGSCFYPRIVASGFTQTGTSITVICSSAHGLTATESFYINANSVLLNPGQYQVATVPDATRFTFNVTNSTSQSQSSFNIYPFGPPPLNRSGTVSAVENTWNMGYTDTSSTYNLGQTPLSAPTVFNYFFPDYQFPGALSSAGLTTPEFQLTSDTSVALQMNFLQAGILGNGNNTNGLSSYNTGNGAIVLDIGPWMTTNFTAAANVPVLVDSMNSLLLAGQLSAAAKTNIINYVTNVTNFPFNTPPSQTQMRDRVRAVVHLILCSPDFTVQR